jgi:hypothetical protein
MADTSIRRKLRIGRLRDAIVFPFQNATALLRLALLPGLAVVIVGAAAFGLFLQATVTTQDRIPPNIYASIALNVLWFLVFTAAVLIFGVGVYRLIPRGEQPGWLPRPRRYHAAFLAVIVFYAVMRGILGVIVEDTGPLVAAAVQQLDPQRDPRIVSGLVIVGLFLLWVWLVIKLLLLLPHAAATGRISPAVSWRAMQGNVWRAVFALLLLSMTMVAVGLVLQLVTVALLDTAFLRIAKGTLNSPWAAFVPVAMFWVAIGIPALVTVFVIAAALVAYIYKDLVDDPAVAA